MYAVCFPVINLSGKTPSLNERIGAAECVVEGRRNVERRETEVGIRESAVAFGFIIGLYK